MTDEDYASTTWPEGFCDIGGKTFQWTLENRAEWCEFTIDKMDKPTGLFEKWKRFLLKSKYGQKERISGTKVQKNKEDPTCQQPTERGVGTPNETTD